MVSNELYQFLLDFRQWIFLNVRYMNNPELYKIELASKTRQLKLLIANEINGNSEPEVLSEIYSDVPKSEIQNVYDIISNDGQLLEFNYLNPILIKSNELRFKSTALEAVALSEYKLIDISNISYPLSIDKYTLFNTENDTASLSKLMLIPTDAYYFECEIKLPNLLDDYEVVVFMCDTPDGLSEDATVPKLIITQVVDTGVVTRTFRLIDSTTDTSIVKTDNEITANLRIGVGYDTVANVSTIYTPYGDMSSVELTNQDLFVYTNNCDIATITIKGEILDFMYFDESKELIYNPLSTTEHTSTLGEL